MCPWGRFAASLHGVPAVASMSLLEVPSSYLLKSGEAGRALKLVPRLLSWLGRYRSVARQLQRHYPVKIPAFPGVLNWSGDLNITYTSAQIHPEASRPSSRHIFIGPPLPGTPEKSDFPFDKLDDSRPLIYVSLGTVFNDNPTFFRQCIEAFGGSGYQVVMSLGSRLSPALLGEVPANFLVVPYVPQVEILKRAALFITHGGVNSVHQALYFGVPLLFVPQQLEQALVATRIAELGAGKVLRKITAPALRETAEHIRDKPGFGERAAALGMGLRAAGGVAKAVDEIEALVAGGRHT